MVGPLVIYLHTIIRLLGMFASIGLKETLFASIIIPNLNAPTIAQTLSALEAQTYDHKSYEIIVVGMDTWGIVRESALVRFISSDRPLSPAQARNRGAWEAKGDILVFTDADCIPRSNWLEILISRFKEPGVTVVGGGIEISPHWNYWTLADNLNMFYEYLAIHPPGERRQLPSLNLAIRRETFMEVGGFDERYPRPSGEDADLTIRLRKFGHRLFFEPRAVVEHYPPRDRLIDLLRHAYYQGMYSAKIDRRYADEEGLPILLRARWALITFAPLISIVAVVRMFVTYPRLGLYWHTFPALYLGKVAWCLGAACHPGFDEVKK